MKFLEGKSKIEKIGNTRQNLQSANGVHGMRRPNSTEKALGNEKIAQNQAPHQTHGHENTTIIAQNEVLTATVGAMEARMSVIENHLQECMLELKTERAKSQITEEQNRQLKNALEHRDNLASRNLGTQSVFDTQKLLNAANPVISQENFLQKLNSQSDTQQNYPIKRKQSNQHANSDGQLHPPSQQNNNSNNSISQGPPSQQNSRNRLHRLTPDHSEIHRNMYETCENLEISENIDISKDIIRTAQDNDFIEEDTPTPRETQPQKSERAPPVETVQIFSRNDTHNSGNSTPREVSTPLDKPRHSNPVVSPLPPTQHSTNNNSQHENIENNISLEPNENIQTNGNFASNPLDHINVENNALKTANSNSSLASSMSHYSESAEETRQQALKSLDELRRSLTEAVANSISSLEQSTANSNTDEKTNEKR